MNDHRSQGGQAAAFSTATCRIPDQEPPSRREHRTIKRILSSTAYIVFAALLLRVGVMLFMPNAVGLRTGWEMANVASSLATGHGFSSPFGRPTGPTAWIPPVYPFLMAVAYRLFGVLSPASGLALILFQVAVSALTCVPIVKLGEVSGNRKVGLCAAWVWACYPYFVFFPVILIWENTFSALLLTWLLLFTMRLRRQTRTYSWVLFGAGWGLAALTNTALLALLPICLGWLWWQQPKAASRGLVLRSAISILIAGLLIAPWCWRNRKAMGAFVPIRSNFGEEFWLGNHDGARWRIHYGETPHTNPQELERYHEMGEIAYVRGQQKVALHFISSHPGTFLNNIVHRLYYWWFGLFVMYSAIGVFCLAGVMEIGWRRAAGGWRLLALAILVFPLVYYLTDVIPRYRHPIEPAMVLVSCFYLESLWTRRRTRRKQAAALGG